MTRSEDGLVHGWDGSDSEEWGSPEPPAVRYSRIVVAVVLLLAGAVVGVLGSVPGAANGATLLGLILGGVGLTVGLREVRR